MNRILIFTIALICMTATFASYSKSYYRSAHYVRRPVHGHISYAKPAIHYAPAKVVSHHKTYVKPAVYHAPVVHHAKPAVYHAPVVHHAKPVVYHAPVVHHAKPVVYHHKAVAPIRSHYYGPSYVHGGHGYYGSKYIH